MVHWVEVAETADTPLGALGDCSEASDVQMYVVFLILSQMHGLVLK